MSLDSSRTAATPEAEGAPGSGLSAKGSNELAELLGSLFRACLAIALALGLSMLVAATAWSAPRVPYTESELRSAESQDEAKIREIRDQEIKQLRIALGRRLPGNRRADLYLRLAETYLEAYRATFLLEGRAHERRLEQGSGDKLIDRSRSRPYLSQGIAACKQILELRIPYAKMDQVYYFLGFNYGELENHEESIRYFDLLTRNHPGSPFVGDAYREMGDAAYRRNEYRRAMGYYEMAVSKSGEDTRPRVLHKLAWTLYRTKQHDRAVSTMKEAIAAASKSGEKFVSLREEALRDMAVFMTESGRAEEAIAYFQSVVGDKTFYPRALERLGRQYERNVEPVKATQVYESLLKTNPGTEAAFRVLVKLVDLDLRRGRHQEALRRVQGAEIPSGGSLEADTQAAAQNLRAMVRRTATERHEAFRKKRDRADLEIAEAYYGAYLSVFLAEDDPRSETPEIQMYLAEVKRELGKSKEASELYRRVVDSRDKRYAKEAGALWTASLSEAIRKSAAKPGERAAEPSKLEGEFVDAADKLHDALGETTEGREAALKASQVLAGYRSTRKDSIKRARKLIERSPRSPQAITAARLWLQLHSDVAFPPAAASGPAPSESEQADALDDLKDAIEELRGNKELLAADQAQGGKLKAQLADAETRMRVGQIARQEREKKFGKAGSGYESFAFDAGTREVAEKAYASSIGAYLKDGDAESVDRVSVVWLKRYPKSPKAIDSVRAAATGYLVQGRFEPAAKLFEKLGHDGGDADSLETAARLFEGIGETERAQQARAAYLELFKASPSRWAVSLAQARAHEAAKQDSEAGKAYRFCMTGPHELEAECGARLADLFMRNQDLAQARSAYRKVAALGPAPEAQQAPAGRGKPKQRAKGRKGGARQEAEGPISPFVAYSRYKLGLLQEQEARFEPLQLPEARLQRAMKQRLDFLEPLSRAYTGAVEAGGPWGVAALDRLAAFAFGIAADIDGIAPPPGAAPASLPQFRKSLEELSKPLRRKAHETWADAYRKALAGEVLSPALPEIADRLADGGHRSPARAQGPRPRLRLSGASPDGGSDALARTREKLVRNPQDAAAWVDYGNLLWGEGKPLLSKILYRHALGLNPKLAPALGNLGVVEAVSEPEDWYRAAAASALFQSALAQDPFFVTAKANRAALLGYYRLFAKAKPLWDQVLAKSDSAEARDGLGAAQQGLGNPALAVSEFQRAADSGASVTRFAAVYHEAARQLSEGAVAKCAERLEALDGAALAGFEKASVERLRKACSRSQAKEAR